MCKACTLVPTVGGSPTDLKDVKRSCAEGQKKGPCHWLAPVAAWPKIKDYKLPYLGGWKHSEGHLTCALPMFQQPDYRPGNVAQGRTPVAVAEALSIDPVPEHKITRPARRAGARKPTGPRERPATSRSAKDAIRRAYDRQYVSKHGMPMCWDALVRSMYSDHGAFLEAANKWRSPRNARTLSSH